MDNKFVRYCIVEPKCRIRMAVLLLLVTTVMGQSWYRGVQGEKLSVLKTRGTVIARITDMEKELEIKAQLEAFKSEDDVSGQVHITKISGTAMHGGKPSVLIDGTVYVEGDAFGDYVVYAITPEMITLINTKTNARKNLYVFE